MLAETSYKIVDRYFVRLISLSQGNLKLLVVTYVYFEGEGELTEC